MNDSNHKEKEDVKNSFSLARSSAERLHFQANKSILKKINVSLCTAAHTNVLFICHNDRWERGAKNYMERIGVFSLIGQMDLETSDKSPENVLKRMSDQVTFTLHGLLLRKAITVQQYEQMMYYNQLSTFRVNQLSFVPVAHKIEIPMQPMLTCYTEEPIKAIARFINNLLEPLLRRVARSTAFVMGTDAVYAFENYAKQGHLRSTTLLVALYIHDLGTTFPHDLTIEALQDFLQTYTQADEIEGTSTATIVRIVQLILQHQFFLYETNLYQQTAGGPLSSPLIITLANLYLCYWQRDLVSILINKKELFGRYFDQIFLTWNGSEDEFRILLDQMIVSHSKQASIQVTTSIGYKIRYLDAEIGHYEGIPRTKVYHESNVEPYALPYVFETTPSLSPINLLQAAIMRAILYCSNVDEFQNELFYIELSFLINDSSLNFIEETIRKFFHSFHAYLYGRFLDEDRYQALRRRIRQSHQQRTNLHIRRRQCRQRRRQRDILVPKN